MDEVRLPPSTLPPSREPRFGGTGLGFGEPGTADTRSEGPSLFASSIEEPRRRSGLAIWFAAAASLVLGIVIGFFSGFRAGQNSSAKAELLTPAPAAASATSGKTFSESSVNDPVRLNPEPIVPAPDVPAPQVRRQVAPAPQVKNPPVSPVPPRTPPRARAVAADTAAPSIVTGPGSLQVVSRPTGAQVYLDDRLVGRTPLSVPDVAVGAHRVRLELTGFNNWATTVDVKAGAALRVAASLEQ